MNSARGLVRWTRTRQAGYSRRRAGYQRSSGLPTTHARPLPRPAPARAARTARAPEPGLLGVAQHVLRHGPVLHQVHAPVPADVHGDVGAVDAPPPPALLEDDVVGTLAVDHPADVEPVERRLDAEGLAVGFEERPCDGGRRPVTPIAAKAPELLRGAVVLARNTLEGLRSELPHFRSGGSGPSETEGVRVAAPRVEVRAVLAVPRGVLGRGVEQPVAVLRGGVAVVVEQAGAQLLVVRIVARLGRAHREGLEQRRAVVAAAQIGGDPIHGLE